MVTRHFLDYGVWVNNPRDGHPRRQLQWILFEIVGVELKAQASEAIADVQDAPYPKAEPELLPAIELHGIDGGHVGWIIRDQKQRGIID